MLCVTTCDEMDWRDLERGEDYTEMGASLPHVSLALYIYANTILIRLVYVQAKGRFALEVLGCNTGNTTVYKDTLCIVVRGIQSSASFNHIPYSHGLKKQKCSSSPPSPFPCS